MTNKREWFIVGAIIILFLCLLAVGGSLVIRLAQDRGLISGAPTVSTPTTAPEISPTPTISLLRENVLRVPAGVPITLDPALAQDSTSIEYIRLLYSGLVTFDQELSVVPDIAENWEVSQDGLTYTFHLRQGVRFHDGRHSTAQDFKYSIERATDPETGSPTALDYLGDIVGVQEKLAGEAEEVDGVQVLDDYTVAITLEQPVVYFLAKLTYPSAFFVDRNPIENGSTEPNGTGPFHFLSAEANRISLARNEDYYRGLPQVERIEFVLAGDFMSLYEEGELDLVEVGAADIERARDPQGPFLAELQVVPSLTTYYIGFNLDLPPFDDPKVRQSLAYATPRTGLVETVFGGSVIEAWGILPPGMPGYNPDLEALPFDAEKAQSLLLESKYASADDLPPITLATADPQLGQILAESYAEILGVNIQVRAMAFSQLLTALDRGEVQMFLLAWGADYVDPQNFLEINFHSQSRANYTHYSNPQVDELLAEAGVEQDRENRLELYRQAEQIVVDEAPWIPLFHGLSYILVKPYVQSLVLTPLGPMYTSASLAGFGD